MKKLFAFLLACTMVFSLSATAFAADSEQPENHNLYTAYNNIVSYAEAANVPLDMSYEEFAALYNGENISDFENSFYEVIQPPTRSSSSGSGKYYYNTGTSCPAEATYSKYNLLDVVQKGDIIFEAAGGFGITGHIAIVEGIYTNSNGDKYIRLVEAIDIGVVRSILDDTRYDDKDVTVMRVSGATKDNINNAVRFCTGELGAKYFIDFQKDTEAGQDDWYCSELVWAAYKNQGIDIEVSGNGEPGITPRDIRNSSKTINRTISKR